jgi:lipid II:glycine glycyltransferase (peptidoglycan interpeptide bridge formation enzyme)
MTKRKGPFSLLGSPLSGMYTEFAGPIFNEEVDKSLKKEILALQDKFIRIGQNYIEWGIIGSEKETEDWTKVLMERNYILNLRPSLVINLSVGEHAVWTGFKSRARNMIRKAEKSNLQVNNVFPNKRWIDEYFDLLKVTFEKQGLSVPHPISFFEQIPSLVKEGVAICLDVQDEGKMIAGAIFVIGDTRMTYLSGVANRQGMQLAAPSLLQWFAMKTAINLNIRDYDLGGLGVESIDKFKRSFGGYEVQHTRLVFGSQTFKLLEPFGRWLHKKGLLSFDA